MIKYSEIERQIAGLWMSLTPIEEDDEIKEVEYTLAHIDSEIDDCLSTIVFENSKTDLLIEHTKKLLY